MRPRWPPKSCVSAASRLLDTSRYQPMIESTGPFFAPGQEHHQQMNTIAVPSPSTFDAASFAAQALSSASALASVLDHTLLKPEATRAQVIHLCHEAAQHRFACAMVNPTW